MGSYADCSIGNLRVDETRNGINADLMRLFQESDKKVWRWPNDDLPPDYADWTDDREEDDVFEVVQYRTTVGVLRDRLSVLGFTTENAERLFLDINQSQQAWLNGRIGTAFSNGPEISETLREIYEKDLDILSRITPMLWKEKLRIIEQEGLHRIIYGGDHHEDPVIDYMLRNEWYGSSHPEILVPLRIAADAFRDEMECIYDITDLVTSGYYSSTDCISELTALDDTNQFRFSSPIIILTEGKSDCRILSMALSKLYPHLYGYYKFFEFDAVRHGGGAGNLVNVLKAFAGAGVANRVVAIFDNDTAAGAALKQIRSISLPDHFRIVQLPEIDDLRSYPTTGPSGFIEMDINNTAASIELFLGTNALTNSQGHLTPVQWTGFDATQNQYQGEILEKDAIHQRFYERFQSMTFDPSDAEWKPLREILTKVFGAFDRYSYELLKKNSEHYFS